MRNGECLDIQRMANKELIKKKTTTSKFMRSQRLVFRRNHFKCLDILSRSNILIKESVKRLSSTFSQIKINERRERDGYREIKGSDAVCMRPVIESSTQWEGASNHQIPD